MIICQVQEFCWIFNLAFRLAKYFLQAFCAVKFVLVGSISVSLNGANTLHCHAIKILGKVSGLHAAISSVYVSELSQFDMDCAIWSRLLFLPRVAHSHTVQIRHPEDSRISLFFRSR